MKRAVLLGVVMFTLGALSTPKAAAPNETMTLLCQRFKAGRSAARIRDIREGKFAPANRASLPGDPLNTALMGSILDSEARALEDVRDMVCAR